MSNFPWESELSRQKATEESPLGDQEAHTAGSPAALAVSADEFAALEQRIRRAVELVKQEREARAAAETRIAELEARLSQAESETVAQMLAAQQIESDARALRAEREQVRQRIERLLTQLDAIEL